MTDREKLLTELLRHSERTTHPSVRGAVSVVDVVAMLDA